MHGGGAPGDHLYVRETWRVADRDYDPAMVRLEYQAKYDDVSRDSAIYTKYWSPWIGVSGHFAEQFVKHTDRSHNRWRRPIHMPKWASRITLEVERVWCEKLHEIREAGQIAEGVEPVMRDTGGFTPWGEGIDMPDYWQGFADTWDTIYAAKGYEWNSNPWVFACEFKVLEVKV